MNNEAKNALIGATGFVGSTLLKQTTFDCHYHSKNIQTIDGQSFDTLVCAGAPGQKWLANREPNADRLNIESLIAHLKTIRCNRFILISTVDVFKQPIGVDEDSVVDESGLHAYGLHRRMLETFVASHFANHLIVRLPGLVGPGLRKNVIFDLLNDNNLAAVNSQNVFQFYPLVNLWCDIETAYQARLPLVHLTGAPVSVSQLATQGFGRTFDQVLPGPVANYDFRSKYASSFGVQGNYQYGIRDTLLAVMAYVQSEPKTLMQGTK